MATFASFANANGVCASRGPGGYVTNTALGTYALCSNTSGQCNTAIGRAALKSNTSGCCNTGFGYQALCSNTTGTGNTAAGTYAGKSMTTGGCLTAIGYKAGCTATGSCNTFVGAFAGKSVTSGTANTLVGYSAGCSLTTGSYNVAVGYQALNSATSASGNVAFGRGALCNVTTGGCNIAVGSNAGQNITTACCTIAFGTGSSPGNTNNHTAWMSAGPQIYNGVGAAWSTVSDSRDKTNIETLDDKLGLEFIRNIEPVSFNFDYRDTYVSKCGYEYGTKDGTLSSLGKAYGFIAQQVKEILDSLEVEFDGVSMDENKDAYRITYSDMIAPLIKAVQQTDSRLKKLEKLAE